jgi:phage baseplate assembly protein W
MVAKAFSIEDGNLQNKTLISSRIRDYKDIDLTFTPRPSKDIFKKIDAAAVKQSVKNLLLTNKTEKPFQPYFGANLYKLLFSNSTEFDVEDVRETIAAAMEAYEPRAYLRDVRINLDADYNTARITVIFQIVSTSEVVQLEVAIARLR